MATHTDAYLCREVIRRNSTTFYLAFRLLPASKRDAVFAVYAFCRDADDAVDLGTGSLPQIKQELAAFGQGQVPDKPYWRELDRARKHYAIDINAFNLMIEGQEMDSHFHIIQDEETLYRYCYLVAGSVGLMLLPILAGKTSESLRQSAADLGTAMQLTNILRDIGEDYRLGRVYLPEDAMRRFCYSREELAHSTLNQAFVDLWEYFAHRAEALYDRAALSFAEYDAESVRVIALAAAYYRGILDVVRKNKYDVFSTRAVVVDAEKQKLRRRLTALTGEQGTQPYIRNAKSGVSSAKKGDRS